MTTVTIPYWKLCLELLGAFMGGWWAAFLLHLIFDNRRRRP
jgi:hypothetical protein